MIKKEQVFIDVEYCDICKKKITNGYYECYNCHKIACENDKELIKNRCYYNFGDFRGDIGAGYNKEHWFCNECLAIMKYTRRGYIKKIDCRVNRSTYKMEIYMVLKWMNVTYEKVIKEKLFISVLNQLGADTVLKVNNYPCEIIFDEFDKPTGIRL